MTFLLVKGSRDLAVETVFNSQVYVTKRIAEVDFFET